jgi:hypothetical protein
MDRSSRTILNTGGKGSIFVLFLILVIKHPDMTINTNWNFNTCFFFFVKLRKFSSVLRGLLKIIIKNGCWSFSNVFAVSMKVSFSVFSLLI